MFLGAFLTVRIEKHVGHTIELEELKETWSLGQVIKKCQGILGEYNDRELDFWKCVCVR